MGRRIAAAILMPLAAIMLTLALVAEYANETVFDSHQFATRATDALNDSAVKNRLAAAVTDRVVLKADKDLIAVKPLIQGAASEVIGTPPFHTLFHGAVEDIHATFFRKDKNTAILGLADTGALLTDAIKRFKVKKIPIIGGNIPRIRIRIEPPKGFVDTVATVENLRWLPFALFWSALILIVVALFIAPDRRRTVIRGGLTLAAFGIVLVLAYRLARSGVISRVPDEERAAAGGVWDAFLGDLNTMLLIITASGAIIAASAASLLRPVDVGAPLRRVWGIASKPPQGTWQGVVWALAYIALGIFIIGRRHLALLLVELSIGVYFIYVGLTEILRLIVPKTEAGEAAAPHIRKRRLATTGGAVGVAVVLIAIVGTAFVTSGGLSAHGDEVGTCNGSAALCDKPFNEVALAGAHNAMSAAEYKHWLFPNQENGISTQLEDGIRALLWDSYYGRKSKQGPVKTALSAFHNQKRKQYQQKLGTPLLDAALRVRDRLVADKGAKREMYLCHRFCETGAIPLAEGLSNVHDFLVAHPHQVMAIVNEDYIAPRDYVKAVEKAGLKDLVYQGPTGPWPTLGEMIDSNQRLVLLAEHRDGDTPWYHPAYAGLMQETPYTFHHVSDLAGSTAEVKKSCRPNRGKRVGSLFLLNNWVDSGLALKPSNAEKVNAFKPLLARARACEKLRGQLPSVVAVDFYNTGDLFKVVNVLNGLAENAKEVAH